MTENAPSGPLFTAEKVREFLEKNPVLFVTIGLLVLMAPNKSGPAWAKDIPPIGGRTAGSWRGKGSFGHGFGPQMGHK